MLVAHALNPAAEGALDEGGCKVLEVIDLVCCKVRKPLRVGCARIFCHDQSCC